MSQYHETKCLICGKPQISPVQHIVCNDCANPDADTVPEYIFKLQQRIKELEALAEHIGDINKMVLPLEIGQET